MFDRQIRRVVNPPLNKAAIVLSAIGIKANAITVLGAVLGLGAGFSIANGALWTALGLVSVNRICDGLDGAVARIRGQSMWGGYLDSLCDYLFYLAVPLGFAWESPTNQFPALLLIASFTLTAVSFLALAAILAGRDLGHGKKAFSYSSGLMEGGETIAFFIAFCLFPNQFPTLALLFAGLCLLTVVQRLWLAQSLLRNQA